MAKISRKERSRIKRYPQVGQRGHIRSLEQQARAEVRLCGWCGKQLPERERPEMGGRRRLFCGPTCQVAKWRHDRRKGAGRCKYCGLLLVVVGGRLGHYIALGDRWGGCPGPRRSNSAVGQAEVSSLDAAASGTPRAAGGPVSGGLRDDQVVDLGVPVEVVETLSLG